MVFSLFSKKDKLDKTGKAAAATNTNKKVLHKTSSSKSVPAFKVTAAADSTSKSDQANQKSASRPRSPSPAGSTRSSLHEMGSKVKQSRIFRNAGYDKNGKLKPEYEAVGGAALSWEDEDTW